jgi:hypothetical protein
MRDLLIVHHNHFYLPWSSEVRRAVLRFLDRGSFESGPKISEEILPIAFAARFDQNGGAEE